MTRSNPIHKTLQTPGPARRPGQGGFTLLEVMVAFTIFFIFAFSVLEMTTRSLAAARAIQEREPDAGQIASLLSLTNELHEGVESGDFEDLYPGMYPGWTWDADVLEAYSNGLFRVNVVIVRQSKKGPAMSEMQILLWRPKSPKGSASGGGPF